MSLNTSRVTLPTVRALLLLLHWPFPKVGGGSDLTFALSGAVVHIVMQIGLHLPMASQEFSKDKLRLTEEDLKMRVEIWGYCALIYQR